MPAEHLDPDLERWRTAGRHFSYKNHAVFFREEGQGEPLLLIHGFPTSSWDWHLLWPALCGRFRVIAVDLLGFGFSAKPRDYAYSLVDQADLIEALLDECGVARVHMLSHDYGDSVVQELLARREDRRRVGTSGIELLSVCLLNGGLFPEAHRPRPIQYLLAGPLGPLLSRFLSERRFCRSFSAVFGPDTKPSRADLGTYWQVVSFRQGQRLAHPLLGYIKERKHFRERWVGALCRTPVPLRLINGPADPVSGLPLVQRYRELVPRADTVILKGIGHYPQVEDPDGVLSTFLEFHQKLKSLRSAPGGSGTAPPDSES